MSVKTKTMTLKLTKEQQYKLRQVAKTHGLVIGRGLFAEDGSIQQMLEAVAAGDLVITMPTPAPPPIAT